MRDQPPSATAPRVLVADDNGDTREMYLLTGHDFKAYLKPAVLAAGAVTS